MLFRLAVALLMLSTTVADTLASTGNGVCPSPSERSAVTPERITPANRPGMNYVGAVFMLVSLSDTGHICDVEVLKGIDDVTNKQAVDAIRQLVFQPIQQSGKPVPGSMLIQRDFWRGDTSDILISENAHASPDEISSDARLIQPADISSLIASGKVEGNSYSNQYFGVSFTAPDATFTAPSDIDSHNRNVRLVEAIARTHDREKMYAISIFADRLANYPQLKSKTEYVYHVSGGLEREGVTRNRDAFPYVISGVEFVGTMLQESDGPNAFHSRGIFSTVAKGYVLSLDVAAPNEQQVLKIASSIHLKQSQ